MSVRKKKARRLYGSDQQMTREASGYQRQASESIRRQMAKMRKAGFGIREIAHFLHREVNSAETNAMLDLISKQLARPRRKR